jgi:hypothetical protein
MDNAANLPQDYIENLIASYPANLIEAYLEGKFVNLTQGTVYTMFDRERCRSEVTVNRKEKEPMHIGMDFNVGKMAAIHPRAAQRQAPRSRRAGQRASTRRP